MRTGRASFVGGFLGAALQPFITRITAKTIGPLLFAGVVAVVWVAQWFRAQPWWAQALIVLLVIVLIARPWRRRTRPVMPPRPALDAQVTFLYRWFSATGDLLYVGISNDLARRTGEHVAGKPWMVEAVRCEATSYPTRLAALEAEEQAIYRENPLYNIVFNR